jgi:P-type Cu+ transporter
MGKLVTLKVEGMTCASCVARVEKALLKNSEVDAANVNLATEKAQIRLHSEDISQTIEKELIALIEKAGYQAYPVCEELRKNKKISVWSPYGSYALVLAFLLSFPLVLPMLLMPFGIHMMLPAWLQFLLATPIQFVLGAHFYVAGFKSLRLGSGSMDSLVAIGTSAAYGLSLYLWQQSGWRNPHDLYFESSALVITLVMLGKWLESRAKKETTEAIRALQALVPKQAKVLFAKDISQASHFHEINISNVLPGDWVLVLPGERLPVDGVVVEGSSDLDESMITGETKMIFKELGSKVVGGTMNGAGRLIIQAQGIGEESTLSQLIRMVENAQAEKAPIQRLVDRVSAWFVPVVILISLLNFLFGLFYFGEFEQSLLHSVAILVIACPCALGLATPAAIMVGTGRAAKLGILIKDAQALELAHRLNVIAFDKTGTLTVGKPQLIRFVNVGAAYTDEVILATAGGLQLGSEHPIAHAVLEYVNNKKINLASFHSINTQSGKGVEGYCDEGVFQGAHLSFISHHAYVALHLNHEKLQGLADEELRVGHSVSWLIHVETQTILAMFSFGDELKPGIRPMIQRLKSMGIRPVMLSGDHKIVAQLIARQVGIDEVYAQVQPADKLRIIKDLKQESPNVCIGMVGDGINDAPALAAADIGIAMGTGTDVAMQASGITLMRGDPALIADAIEISSATWKKIKQNLFWAFFYNLIGIPLAAMGYLSPVIAGAAMAASSVSVMSNALLLRRWKSSVASGSTFIHEIQ